MQIFWALGTKQSIVKVNFLNYFIKAFFCAYWVGYLDKAFL